MHQNDETLKVLIIDDTPEDRELYSRALKSRDDGDHPIHYTYSLKDAETGKEGLILNKRFRPDCVLLDFRLPDLDGLEILSEILDGDGANQPAIILLTGHGNEAIAVEALKRGASDYIIKNEVTPIRLKTAIFQAIESKKLARQIKELSEVKSDFLSFASHELRTPLSIIRDYISIVTDGITGEINDKQRECLTAALQNCDRLGRLIDDILNLRRIESGHIELVRRNTSLGPLIKTIEDAFRTRLREKNQTLDVLVSDDLPPVLCDKEKVRQILINLLGNANKYTPDGGSITLRARIDESGADMVMIEVSDTGKGINDQDIEKIWDKFQQVGRTDGPGPRGTGLGLTIVKSLVHLHDGEVGVTSNPGKGTTFSFTLPSYSEKRDIYAFLNEKRQNALANKMHLAVFVILCNFVQDIEVCEDTIPELLKREGDDIRSFPGEKTVLVSAEMLRADHDTKLHRRLVEALSKLTGIRITGGILPLDQPVETWLTQSALITDTPRESVS